MRVYILLLFAVVVTCQEIQGQGIMSGLVSNLRRMPVIGNFLRASVDPVYRPFINYLPSSGIQSREGEETDQCYGEIGCLVTPPEFFHPLHRPINLPPFSRDEVNVTYRIHTRQIPHGTIVPALELQERFNRSSFNPRKDTKIIIHGFLDSYAATWMVDMVRAFHEYGDINVITVDWSGGARALYTQATANTRLVGLEVAHLVNWLHRAYSVNPAKLHIIGHSLGAHTSGYAGERIPGLGRITGLDPAEPYFQYMDPVVRLDPSDASFVDVIHSDSDSILSSVLALGYGMEQPSGHIDFYPNDGRSQPGCSEISRIPLTVLSDGIDLFEGLDAGQKEFISCNHIRAPKMFTDSILSKCPYTAFQCDSFENYSEGLCMDCGVSKTNCAPMGFHADKWQDRSRKNVKMFLSTKQGPAYCTYHYRLDVAFSDPENIGDSLRGRLKISLISKDGTLIDFDLTPDSPMIFKKGSSISFALTHPEDLTGSRQALITWTYEPDIFAPLSYCVPLFCSSDLQITALALTSFDSKAERSWNPAARVDKIEEIIMCHTLGDRVINIPSEKTVNVATSTSCPDIITKINKKFLNQVTSTHNENDIIWEVERVWPKHLKPWRPWKTWGNHLKKSVVTAAEDWGNNMKNQHIITY
ncbi:unnamed protein product [Meganyctiphanes norvegica]|uniref:Lipase domain-containing protein n=1 Tax=Meganyctiphanes norvegica TaxID=48144 RepID=A0AAV2R5D5_MEGNR